jgi:hypothetical protein
VSSVFVTVARRSTSATSAKRSIMISTPYIDLAWRWRPEPVRLFRWSSNRYRSAARSFRG